MVRYTGTYGGLSEKERERNEQLADLRHFAITHKVLLEDLAIAKSRGKLLSRRDLSHSNANTIRDKKKNAEEIEKIEASLKRLEEIRGKPQQGVRRPQYVPKPIEEPKLAEKQVEGEPTEELHDEFVIDDVIRELRIQTKLLKKIVRLLSKEGVLNDKENMASERKNLHTKNPQRR